MEVSPAAAADTAALAARLAAAEAQLSALRVELAVAEEKAESYKALALAKDEIIASARKQTSEWRKHVSEVLKASTPAGAAPAKEEKKKSSSSKK